MNLLMFTSIMVSCAQVKDISYFQQTNQEQTTLTSTKYDATIKPKDQLSITVVSSEPTASSRYNLIMPQIDSRMGNIQSQPAIQSYLVDSEGTINFPTLGKKTP